MTDVPRRVVVVGASAAGLTAVETLRSEGFDGDVALVGAETHLPYDRPPLSKQILSGVWSPSRVELRQEPSYAGLDVALRLGTPAVDLDVRERVVTLDDGTCLEYDALLVATGGYPRRLPSLTGLPCVHVLRTLDDVAAFRAAALAADPVLVVGAGFLGTEVAATLTGLGRRVVLVDAEPAPMRRQLGRLVADRLIHLHRQRSVDVRAGTTIEQCRSVDDGRVDVLLGDGSVVRTGCVLVAVGVTPAVEWLRNSGISTADGVECDSGCRAAPGVFAAGDVARWFDRGSSTHRRVEHRTNATEQAICAARNLLGAGQPYLPVPYFWSDQFEARIQVYGDVTGAREVAMVHGSADDERFVALYGDGERVVGALGWRAPRELLRVRSLVVDQAPWREVGVA